MICEEETYRIVDEFAAYQPSLKTLIHLTNLFRVYSVLGMH